MPKSTNHSKKQPKRKDVTKLKSALKRQSKRTKSSSFSNNTSSDIDIGVTTRTGVLDTRTGALATRTGAQLHSRHDTLTIDQYPTPSVSTHVVTQSDTQPDMHHNERSDAQRDIYSSQ